MTLPALAGRFFSLFSLFSLLDAPFALVAAAVVTFVFGTDTEAFFFVRGCTLKERGF